MADGTTFTREGRQFRLNTEGLAADSARKVEKVDRFSEVDRVSRIQEKLGIPVTGKWDTTTNREFTKFLRVQQAEHIGIDKAQSDGWWGKNTEAALKDKMDPEMFKAVTELNDSGRLKQLHSRNAMHAARIDEVKNASAPFKGGAALAFRPAVKPVAPEAKGPALEAPKTTTPKLENVTVVRTNAFVEGRAVQADVYSPSRVSGTIPADFIDIDPETGKGVQQPFAAAVPETQKAASAAATALDTPLGPLRREIILPTTSSLPDAGRRTGATLVELADEFGRASGGIGAMAGKAAKIGMLALPVVAAGVATADAAMLSPQLKAAYDAGLVSGGTAASLGAVYATNIGQSAADPTLIGGDVALKATLVGIQAASGTDPLLMSKLSPTLVTDLVVGTNSYTDAEFRHIRDTYTPEKMDARFADIKERFGLPNEVSVKGVGKDIPLEHAVRDPAVYAQLEKTLGQTNPQTASGLAALKFASDLQIEATYVNGRYEQFMKQRAEQEMLAKVGTLGGSLMTDKAAPGAHIS